MAFIDDISGWNLTEDNLGDSGGVGLAPYTPPEFSQTPTTNPTPNLISAGGDVLSGIGAYMQGQEAAKADEYNASLALMQGQFQTEQIGLEEVQTLATQKAMYAKAGVELEGSALDTALATATQYEYSKEIATFNAQSQANMDNYEANMAKQKGQFGLASGLLQGAGALLPLVGL